MGNKEKIILHCDINNFFASVECVLNPNISTQPVAVGGDVIERHGIILAKNYVAKSYGIVTGDTIQDAKLKCKDILIVKPHYLEYQKYSHLARNIYKRFTDKVESFGMDECWLDVTDSVSLFGSPKELADKIRLTIKEELGLTISVGVSFNKIFAKLGSDMKKPDATTVISKDDYKEKVWPLPIEDLLGVGRNTRKVLRKYFINTIGDLAKEDKKTLERLFGKNGITLYEYANGLYNDEVIDSDDDSDVKSIGHGTTTMTDITSKDEVWKILFELSKEISYKLRKYKKRAKGVSISIRNNELEHTQFQKQFSKSVISTQEISKAGFELFNDKYLFERPIKSITITAIKLIDEDECAEEFDILADDSYSNKLENIENTVEKINDKYSNEKVDSAVVKDNDFIAKSTDFSSF